MSTGPTDINPGARHLLHQANAALSDLLRENGLRPTRPRLALARLLFGGDHLHVSAEQLHAQVLSLGETTISLATIYNALHEFAKAGLLHAIPVPVGPACYDTNTASHNHLLIGAETTLLDAPYGQFIFDRAAYASMGLTITSVDVLLRAQRK